MLQVRWGLGQMHESLDALLHVSKSQWSLAPEPFPALTGTIKKLYSCNLQATSGFTGPVQQDSLGNQNTVKTDCERDAKRFRSNDVNP